MNIKVGQIRGDKNPYVITKITKDGSNFVCDTLFRDGQTYKAYSSLVEIQKLIKEYATWQEAVVSPEFSGDRPGIPKTLNQKYEILRDACKEITKNPIITGGQAYDIATNALWDVDQD